MKRLTRISFVGSLLIAGVASVAPAAQAAPEGSAMLMVVQAVPGQSLDVEIDEGIVSEGSETGDVLGPFTVPAGAHQVTFSDPSGAVVVDTTVQLVSGSTQDLVVHLPAQPEGSPVATVYATPTSPVAVGKARVLIAHTASVAPADVRLDGTVVFRNIANGEFATADVAEGAHVAELLPSGLTTRPILGPLDVSLAPATATMVYAVGNTKDDSMQAITHNIALSADDAEVPTTIDAGSAGLAAGINVTPFSAMGPAPAAQGPARTGWLLFGGAIAALLALAGARRHGRRVTVEASR